MSGPSHDVEDSRLKEIESLVGQLVGRYQPDGSADREVEGDSIDRTLAGLRALVEVDVLRQLPKPRFQEILASAVSTEWKVEVISNPIRQRDVPSTPKISGVESLIRSQKIVGKCEPE